MNRADLIRAIHAGRTELEAAWSGVAEVHLVARPGPQTDWSVKDLIAHITYWEQTMIANVRAVLVGGRAQWGDVDAINADVLAAHDDRALEAVLADFHRSARDVMALVENLSPGDLARPTVWRDQQEPVWMLIAGDTFEHYQDHLRDVRAWRARQETGA